MAGAVRYEDITQLCIDQMQMCIPFDGTQTLLIITPHQSHRVKGQSVNHPSAVRIDTVPDLSVSHTHYHHYDYR